MTFKLKLNQREKRLAKAQIKQSTSVKTNKEIYQTTSIIVPNSLNSKNCRRCSLFFACNDPNKRYDYVCEKFIEKKVTPFDFSNNNRFTLSGPSIEIPQVGRSQNYSDLEKLQIDNNDDLDKLLSKITQQFSTGVLRDLRVDDGDLPLAKNYCDFWFNTKFVGNGDLTYPFAKQIEMAINLLSEYCPVCSNVSYVKSIPTDHSYDQIQEQITLLEYGNCPKCHKNRLEFWNNKEYKYKRYTDMIGIAGQRGGKTAGVSRLNGYMFHRWLKLNRPQKVYGVEDNVWLEFCFTATTFGKALENLYDPLSFTLKNNPWFIQYHQLLDFYGNKYGHELYKILGETAFYNHRNYILYPKSPDPSNLRGSTRALAEIDELAHLWAKSNDAKKMNPKEVHNVLSNSLLTLRMEYAKILRKGMFDIPQPLMCNITSPRTINDYGMHLYRLSQDEISRTYSFHYNIYEMNPNAKDMEDLEQIKRERPEDFKRDFMAIPPSAANAFIEDKNVVAAAVDPKLNRAIILKQGPIQGHAKNVKMMSGSFEIRKKAKIKKAHHILSLDAGTRFNSFALCLAHLEVKDHGDFEVVTKVFDVITEIIPENDYTISIADVYDNVIAPLIEEFNVIHISADRWNSQTILSNASEEFDIEFKQYSCKMRDFIEFRTSLYSGDIKIPIPEITIKEAFELSTYNYPLCFKGKPIAHAMLQMLTVENYIKSVEKGQGYTDDIFRAMVLANRFLSDEELKYDLMAPVDAVVDNDTFVGAIATGTGRLTGIGGGNLTANTRGGNSEGDAVIGSIVSLPGFGR